MLWKSAGKEETNKKKINGLTAGQKKMLEIAVIINFFQNYNR